MISALALSASAQTNDALFLDSMTNSFVNLRRGKVGVRADVATDSSHYASGVLDTADLLSSGNVHYALDGLSLRLVLEYEFNERFSIGAFAEISDLREEQDLAIGGAYLAFKFGSISIRPWKREETDTS